MEMFSKRGDGIQPWAWSLSVMVKQLVVSANQSVCMRGHRPHTNTYTHTGTPFMPETAL